MGWGAPLRPALVAGMLLGLVVIGALVLASARGPAATVSAAGRPVQAGWSEMPPDLIPSRTGAVAVATDRELIVWGGQRHDLHSDGSRASGDGPRSDGAAYSFEEGTWRPMAPSPLTPRSHAIAVWTGAEVLFWGGLDAGHAPLAGAAAYDPATDRWREIETFDGAVGSARTTGAAWTGEELVLVGVTSPGNAIVGQDTIMIEPSGEWVWPDPSPAALVDDPDRTPRARAAVWTGTEVLVVTIVDGSPVTVDHLDPRSGRWGASATTGADGLMTAPEAVVWTGSELVVAGPGAGATYDPATGHVADLAPPGGDTRYPAVSLGDGIVSVGDRWLDTGTGTWTATSPVPGRYREFPVAAGHDGVYYLWGGDGCGGALSCIELIDPGPGLRWSRAGERPSGEQATTEVSTPSDPYMGLRPGYQGSPQTGPDEPLSSILDVVTCAELHERSGGDLRRFGAGSGVGLRATCWIAEAQPSFFGVLYVPDAMSVTDDGFDAILRGGGVLLSVHVGTQDPLVPDFVDPALEGTSHRYEDVGGERAVVHRLDEPKARVRWLTTSVAGLPTSVEVRGGRPPAELLDMARSVELAPPAD